MTPDRIDWNELRVLLEVARSGGLGGAAKRLGVDASTVSRRIAHLETMLGESLFERSRGGLVLNALGHRLVEHVSGMDSEFAMIVERLGESGGAHGRVRIASMEGIGSLYLSRVFAEFREQLPTIEIELVTSTQQVHVTRREADIFLSFFAPGGRGLEVERVARFGLHLYASPSYLARRGAPQSLADLAEHQFVGYIDDLVQIDEVRWLESLLPEPPLCFYSTSMLAQMFTAAAGAGLVMLPSFSAAERFGLERVLEGEFELGRDLWLSVHRDLRYAPRIKRVVRALEDAIRADDAFTN
ncbi:LysR family transcriptional regulator [Halotalea alkalilenta]|uniref:LysR family transcriptional regulator n=1 Tax=Halotalea alkalilenta TaxID=376489 RepID=UPI00048251D8|nr:LysR family transcriptional regulator [Halotalea alkalilenta]